MSHEEFKQKIYSNPPEYPIPAKFLQPPYETDPDYKLPLTSDERLISSGMLLASGEANDFDFSQHVENNAGSGINSKFPYSETFPSGIVFKTYPEDPESLILLDDSEQTGIFHANGLDLKFSNSKLVK